MLCYLVRYRFEQAQTWQRKGSLHNYKRKPSNDSLVIGKGKQSVVRKHVQLYIQENNNNKTSYCIIDLVF